MAFSTTFANLLLDWGFTAGTAVRPTAWYVSFHTGDPGTTGANEVLVASDANYVRQSITYAAASGGANASTNQISYTPAVAAGTYSVTHAGIWSASTSGTFYLGGALVSPRSISNANPLVFEIGEVIAALS